MTKLEELQQRLYAAEDRDDAVGLYAAKDVAHDLLLLCEQQDRELRKAVRLLSKWRPLPDGYRESVDAFLARHKENDHE
jgi:hypothetical protein